MDDTCFADFFQCSIQSDQIGKYPGPCRTGDLNPQREYDAFVFSVMNQLLIVRPHGTTVTAFTIDMLATMLTGRVVTSVFQNAFYCETIHNCCGIVSPANGLTIIDGKTHND